MAFRLIFIVFTISTSLCTNAEECLGVPGACKLTLQEVTLAGSHNSCAGFDGLLYHHNSLVSIPALSCAYRNQDVSIYDQLKIGVRYLDIDTCYEDREKYQPKGAWACHSGAMGGPVEKVLDQIDKWINEPKNRREIVVLDFNRDFDKEYKAEIGKSLTALLKKRWEPTPIRRANNNVVMATNLSQTLGNAVAKNERIFVFLHDKLNPERPSYFFANQLIGYTWTSMSWLESNNCKNLADKVSDKCATQATNKGYLRLDLYLTWGLCNDALAYFCNPLVESAAKTCYSKVRSQAARKSKTINFIVVDYIDNDSGKKVVSVAKALERITNNVMTIRLLYNFTVKCAWINMMNN